MMLKAFDAIATCRFAGRAAVIPRQVDSCARSELPVTDESDDVVDMPSTPALPTDIDALPALLAAERAAHAAVIAERDQLSTRNGELATRNSELVALNARLESAKARLQEIVTEMRRARFGRKSERISEAQLALALEELEIAAAKIEAETEKADPALKRTGAKKRRASRNENLDHLPHEEIVIEPEGGTTCACCGGGMHVIGVMVEPCFAWTTARSGSTKSRPSSPCSSRAGRSTPAGPARRPAPTMSPASCKHRLRRGSSKAGCRPRRWSPTSWCRSTRITCRSIASRKSWRAQA